MNIPKSALENHQFTIVMVVMLVAAGLVSFFTMPRSEDPQVSPAGSSVIVVYPGADPEDMETLIVDPLEEAINELEDIKKFDSIIRDGLAVLQIEFHSGSDPEKKYTDVVQKVNRTQPDLPKEILSLETLKWSITNVNIFQYALVSDSLAYTELEALAENLKTKISRVAGISRVKTWAYPEQQVRIELDLEKLARLQVPVGLVQQAVSSSNLNIPGGTLDIGPRKLNIRTSGFYKSLEEIGNTVVLYRGGRPVYVRDLGQVRFDYADPKHIARFNGQRAVFISARQKEATNIFDIMGEVNKIRAEFSSTLPARAKLETVFDQSKSVASRLNVFFSNLFQGMLLVGFLIFLVYGFRASLVIAAVIPIAVIIGIGMTDLSGYGLEQMSIAALVIALGMLVDNAIVVTENIVRFMKMGYSKAEAAHRATSQVAWPVVSSTLTTVFAFIPMILMQNITGDFIRSMPVTVVYTLMASLLMALTFTPYLASRLLKDVPKVGRTERVLEKFVVTVYRRRLDFALRHRGLVLITSLVIFMGSLGLFGVVGVSFFPKADKAQFMINIEMPQGVSLDETDAVTRKVETILQAQPDIKKFASNVGRSNPQIYYNVIERNPTSNFSQIYVDMGEAGLPEIARRVEYLREWFATFPEAHIEVKEFEQGPPVVAPVAIKILGDNLETLRRIAADVEKIYQEKDGLINIGNPLRTSALDLQIKINREKAGRLNIPLVEIDRAVRMAAAGLTVTSFRDEEGKDYEVVISGDKRELKVQDLKNIYVTAGGGVQIPLEQLASLELKQAPGEINHFKLDRNVTLTADVRPGYSIDRLTKAIIADLEAYNWPEGYQYYVSGELESREESFGGLGQAVIVAMLAIFGILVLQFRSFLQPFIVFAAIPLAVVGSILALLITGYSFSFTAFIGLTALVGIVVNNSIILVDYTNVLRLEGKDTITAVKEAAETRFMPIFLTTTTTIGGLLPLALGGGTLWAPMSWTIIGGLGASMVLTLLVVPVLYQVFTPKLIPESGEQNHV